MGAWFAAAAPGALTWALAEATGAELADGRFGTEVVLPNESPWLMHAARQFGVVLAHLLGFLAVLCLAWRFAGGRALAATCVAFGIVAAFCTELLRYGWFRRSSLEILAQNLGMPDGGQSVRQVTAVLAMAGIVVLLRLSLRRAAVSPWSGFAIPACLLLALADETAAGARFPDSAWGMYIPTVLAAVAALTALQPRQSWQAPSLGVAAAAAIAGAVALVAPAPAPTPDRNVEWAEASSGNWNVRFEAAAFPPERRDRWLAGAEERLKTYSERLGLRGRGTPMEIHVAASERAMGSIVGNRSRGSSFVLESPSGAATVGTTDGLPEDPRIEAVLAMRRAWGESGSDAMALALARYAIGEFGNWSLHGAASRIACEEMRYPASAVFDTDGKFLSPLVRDGVAGAWIEGAVARNGSDVLRELYKGRLTDSLGLCPDCVPPCDMQFGEEVPLRVAPPYLKGISFSHEVRGGGYGSVVAGRQLERIRNLGANAVALVPYAFTRAPDEPSIRFRTLETDARLGRSARRARELGLRVMLKPHLWAGRRFHGSIEFQSKARFQLWFEDYSRWMLHYARLAELHGIDVLAIGNELAGVTVFEDEWRSLVRDVRRVFRGPVTYAAHWESELPRVGFWDELDYIGVNFYFPIAASRSLPASDSAEMERAARVIATVQDRFAKPVLFTEVGFPAVATAAARPWEENASALDPGLQALCYQAWFERFARGPGVNGMFWWKWPSHGQGSPMDPSHQPLAKPALAVLREWFGQL